MNVGYGLKNPNHWQVVFFMKYTNCFLDSTKHLFQECMDTYIRIKNFYQNIMIKMSTPPELDRNRSYIIMSCRILYRFKILNYWPQDGSFFARDFAFNEIKEADDNDLRELM